MTLEQKIKKIEDDLTNLDKQWQDREDQLRQAYNQEYGAYIGRRGTLKEVLELLKQDEKNESSPEKNESE